MFELVLQISLVGLSIAMIGLLYRVIKGPSIPDRVIALDAIGINLIAMVAIFSIILQTHAYFEVILLIGILSFIGTTAFSKYLEKGAIINRERDN